MMEIRRNGAVNLRTGSSTEQSNPLLKGRLGVRIPPGACGQCAPVAQWQSRRLLSGGCGFESCPVHEREESAVQ